MYRLRGIAETVMNCGLCSGKTLHQVRGADERVYRLCPRCRLIGVSPEYFLSDAEEKKRYLSHNNSIGQPGYVDFLNRAVLPALKYLHPSMLGLDYGCGYAPTLSVLLARRGFRCEDYDPCFVENPLNKKYDYLFSTEVFEHFFHPRREIAGITGLLKPGGLLTVMTERWSGLRRFRNWYYTRDPAHVAFYHRKTFDYIRHEFGFVELFDDGRSVMLFRKEA